jgi:hypothetical protein
MKDQGIRQKKQQVSSGRNTFHSNSPFLGKKRKRDQYSFLCHKEETCLLLNLIGTLMHTYRHICAHVHTHTGGGPNLRSAPRNISNTNKGNFGTPQLCFLMRSLDAEWSTWLRCTILCTVVTQSKHSGNDTSLPFLFPLSVCRLLWDLCDTCSMLQLPLPHSGLPEL